MPLSFLQSTLLRFRLPRTAILMMQRDEHRLLRPWFTHHARLFGAGNLCIFDNGSARADVVDTLGTLSDAGATVIWDHDDHQSFRDKGLVFLRHMKTLRGAGYRFFIPLDCDEFLAVDGPDGPDVSAEAIYAELLRCRGTVACQTAYCYLNHPANPGLYRRAPFKKVCGTFDGIDWLGEGFHHVRTPMEPSRLAYVHLRYRPYDEFRARAAAKIVAHERSLEEESLRAYAASRDNGRHAAQEYLMSREAYEASFARKDYVEYPHLRTWFLEHLGQSAGEGI